MGSASTQYVQVPVRAYSGGSLYNPTALPVYMAFISGSGQPSASEWNSAGWAWTTSSDGFYAAQCLVGPENSAVTLATGGYTVWVKVEGNEEVPVIAAGALTII